MRAEGAVRAIEERARRLRWGGVPGNPVQLAEVVLGPPAVGTMLHVGAKREEAAAIRAAEGTVGSELAALARHIVARPCEPEAEALRALVSQAVDMIAAEDRGGFRKLGRQIAKELAGGKLSAWQAVVAGAEALRASWSELERQEREEAERRRHEERQAAADRALDQALAERVAMLDERFGARQGSGAPDAASGPAAGNGEDAAPRPRDCANNEGKEQQDDDKPSGST